MANRPRSQWGDDERADVGARHRTPLRGVPVEVHEENSSNYEGPELVAWREGRQMPDRVRRLEDKHDELAKVVGETRADVREMRGEMKALPRLVDLIEKMASGAHVALTAQVKVDAAEKLDEIDERKTERRAKHERRKTIAKIVGAASLPIIGALAHYLAGQL